MSRVIKVELTEAQYHIIIDALNKAALRQGTNARIATALGPGAAGVPSEEFRQLQNEIRAVARMLMAHYGALTKHN